MADSKITDLAELTAPDLDADFLPIVDVSDTTMAGSGTNKKVRPRNLGVVAGLDSATKKDTQTIATTTFTDVTGLSVTYTPKSASNKILVRMSLSMNGQNGSTGANARLMRGSTPIGVGDAAGSRDQVTVAMYEPNQFSAQSPSAEYLDSPATTSPVTYKVQAKAQASGTIFINRRQDDTDAAGTPRMISTLTLMEVTA